MSLLFPIFPHVPDFRDATSRSISTLHERINLAAGRGEVLFPQRTPDILINHPFAVTTRRELAEMKEFFRDKGGRAWAFFLPSWRRDVKLAGPVPALTKQIAILSPNEDYASKHLDNTDADHPGRFLYFYRDGQPVFGTDIIRVLPGDVAGQEILDLDIPPPFALDEKTWVGWLYLARFTDDQLTWTHYSPDHAETEIGFRVTRRAIQNEVTKDLTRTDQYGQVGFVSARMAPGDIEPVTNRIAYTTGPANLHAAQEELYYSPWAAWPGVDGVRIKKLLPDEEIWLPNNTGSNSILFSGPVVTDHIAFCFDQNSYEVIGYQKTRTTIEIRRFFNLAVDVRTFDGIDPLLQFNGLLNANLETSETDVVCYYLKPDTNALFMRFQRDNFGTEYVACALPSRPLALKRAYYVRDEEDEDEGTLVVEYVDAGLRIAQLFSAVYEAPEPPVPPPDEEIEASAADVAGVQLSANFDGYEIGVQYWDGQPFLSLHTPIKDETNTVFLSDSASYTSTLVYYDGGTIGDPHTPLSDAPTAPILSHSAAYVLSIIPADSEPESATVSLSETSTYVLGAIGIPSSGDSSIANLEHSLVYEPI